MVSRSKNPAPRQPAAASPTLRAQPQQLRAQATVEHLLAISAELLEEVGIEKFNTNLLAERAGVGIRAIYRYFPNKHAVLSMLYEAHRRLDEIWIGDLRHLATGQGWRANVRKSIDSYFQAASNQRGYAALRRASMVSPELSKLDAHHNAVLQSELAAGLRGLGVKIGDKHMEAVCRTIIESANRVLDIALHSDDQEARLLLTELKKMIILLLSDYVHD